MIFEVIMDKVLKLITVAAAVLLCDAHASAISGSWRGKLSLGQASLPLVFNFKADASGKTVCTMDSPSQGAKGIPVTVEICTTDSIKVTCGAIGASYSGAVKDNVIKGQFVQRGYSFPLDLTAETSDRRPQTPVPPFPYSVSDTVFTAADGAVMSATLTVPANASSAKMPAVVMVTGSGPQNRDEELFDHKPFAVIADYLARNGIASLRYDDRGTGKSGGNFATATTVTFKDDAASAVDFLRTVGCVGKVGVLGHSEGGTIAFMLGAEGKADFIISLAGMAISGKETLMRQNRHALESAGLPEDDKENSLKLIENLFDEIIAQVAERLTAPIDIDKLAKDSGLEVPAQILSTLKMTQSTRSSWFDMFLALNPRDFIGKVKCPVLAINGDKDTQVSTDNLTLIKQLNPKARTMLMTGLNHLMQHAITGEVSEYDDITETISPEVLQAIATFVTTASR